MSNQINSDDVPVKENTSSIIHMQEFSSLLTPERLDGTNYVEWSLNVDKKIRGKKNGASSLEKGLLQKTNNLKNMKHGKTISA